MKTIVLFTFLNVSTAENKHFSFTSKKEPPFQPLRVLRKQQKVN